MTRHEDWRARLNAFLKANADRPFEWGAWDCCLGLASGAVEAMTGADYAEPYRGRYRSKSGAFRRLREIGGVKTPDGLVTSIFGEPDHPAFARTGDLVLRSGCIGVFSGGRGLFVGCEMTEGGRIERDGLVSFERKDLEACWHV